MAGDGREEPDGVASPKLPPGKPRAAIGYRAGIRALGHQRTYDLEPYRDGVDRLQSLNPRTPKLIGERLNWVSDS